MVMLVRACPRRWLAALMLAPCCVLAGYRAWGYDRHPRFARGWWSGARRWSLHTLWRGYQQALHASPAVHPARATARGTWAEMEAWLHQLDALGTTALVA
jgi:hypothetical protein